MRLAAVLLLAQPALVLTGTMVRALGYSPFEAALATVLLAAVVALGAAVWRRSPRVYWLAVLVALAWLTAQGLRLVVTARELSKVAGSLSYLTGLVMSTSLSAAVLTLLLWKGAPARDTPAARQAGRLVRIAVGAEAALVAAILSFGFALERFGSDVPWYRIALGLTQLPGVIALASLDQCCGFAGGIVLSDAIDPFWGGLYPIGMPVLGFANAVVVAGVISALTTVGRRLATRAAPSIPRAGERDIATRCARFEFPVYDGRWSSFYPRAA